jgi:hypothetical protein
MRLPPAACESSLCAPQWTEHEHSGEEWSSSSVVPEIHTTRASGSEPARGGLPAAAEPEPSPQEQGGWSSSYTTESPTTPGSSVNSGVNVEPLRTPRTAYNKLFDGDLVRTDGTHPRLRGVAGADHGQQQGSVLPIPNPIFRCEAAAAGLVGQVGLN